MNNRYNHCHCTVIQSTWCTIGKSIIFMFRRHNIMYDVSLRMDLLWRGRWWMMGRDQCPGLRGWWGHAHQYDEPHGSGQGSGWGHSSQHPEVRVETYSHALKNWKKVSVHMQAVSISQYYHCTFAFYRYMYMYILLVNFLPGQGEGYQIVEHSQGSYGRHHPGNWSITNKE